MSGRCRRSPVEKLSCSNYRRAHFGRYTPATQSELSNRLSIEVARRMWEDAMIQRVSLASISRISLVGLMLAYLCPVGQDAAQSPPTGMRVATGQRITPSAAPGTQVLRLHTDLRSDENADASNAVTTALSPDGSTLLILTSGSNNSFYKDDGTPIVYD